MIYLYPVNMLLVTKDVSVERYENNGESDKDK